MLHNVIDVTEVLNAMTAEGYEVTSALVGRLSPYLTEHIRRFGQYVLDMEMPLEPLVPKPVLFTNGSP
jgi:hypothetical protein